MSVSIGNVWLKENFNLPQFSLNSTSYINNYDKIEINTNGTTTRFFGKKYGLKSESPLEHIVFSLKHEELNLGLLKAVFEQLSLYEIKGYIEISPKGKYERKIGFLYEFLTDQFIHLSTEITGNYIDLLDEEKYVTGLKIKSLKWKILNNLLGSKEYCPIIRKTNELKELLSLDFSNEIKQLQQNYSPAVFNRAISYLFTKETRSSYEIEREIPSPDRLERFIGLLQQAGAQSLNELLDEKSLMSYQNSIVDPRFSASGFRNFQNYIGENSPNFSERIHYICPSPEKVNSLMDGLKLSVNKSDNTHPIIKATIISFGFVFIHPFEDGNGRLHRFLIHDSFVRDKLIPNGFVIPISANMLNNRLEYDNVLENYSKPILPFIKYSKNNAGELTILNPLEIEPYYTYPDLTAQSVYLSRTVQQCVIEDMPNELDFIQLYDELKIEIQQLVDMPDKMINRFILFLHQNKGVFPKRRREEFNKLTDNEIKRIEVIYKNLVELQ